MKDSPKVAGTVSIYPSAADRKKKAGSVIMAAEKSMLKEKQKALGVNDDIRI